MRTTTYIKGKRSRSESMGGAVISITQRHLHRGIRISPSTRTFMINEFAQATQTSTSAAFEMESDGVVGSGGVVTPAITAKDTGERRRMYGYPAKHLIITMETVSSPDACNPNNTKMEMDGWYVWNDGVVPVPSAVWSIKDSSLSNNVHTDLTGKEDLSRFVKPRLAVGPKVDHIPEVSELWQYMRPVGQLMPRNYGVAFSPDSFHDDLSGLRGFEPNVGLEGPFAKSLTLGPWQTLDLEIPFAGAANFGVTFMAAASVGATLTDEEGKVLGTNGTKSAAANTWFRSIFYDQPTALGMWKIHLENTAGTRAKVLLVAYHDAVK